MLGTVKDRLFQPEMSALIGRLIASAIADAAAAALPASPSRKLIAPPIAPLIAAAAACAACAGIPNASAILPRNPTIGETIPPSQPENAVNAPLTAAMPALMAALIESQCLMIATSASPNGPVRIPKRRGQLDLTQSVSAWPAPVIAFLMPFQAAVTAPEITDQAVERIVLMTVMSAVMIALIRFQTSTIRFLNCSQACDQSPRSSAVMTLRMSPMTVAAALMIATTALTIGPICDQWSRIKLNTATQASPNADRSGPMIAHAC